MYLLHYYFQEQIWCSIVSIYHSRRVYVGLIQNKLVFTEMKEHVILSIGAAHWSTMELHGTKLYQALATQTVLVRGINSLLVLDFSWGFIDN